jgi:hypothetical protein
MGPLKLDDVISNGRLSCWVIKNVDSQECSLSARNDWRGQEGAVLSKHNRSCSTIGDLEVSMSPQGNKYHYAKEFDGDLHIKTEAVPVRVKTNLRVMSKEEARQAWIHRLPFGVPQYTFMKNADSLPTHPSLEATGRHYFTW